MGPLTTSISSKLIKKPFASNYRNQSYLTIKDCEQTPLLMKVTESCRISHQKAERLGGCELNGPGVWTTVKLQWVRPPQGMEAFQGSLQASRHPVHEGLRAVSINKNRGRLKGHTLLWQNYSLRQLDLAPFLSLHLTYSQHPLLFVFSSEKCTAPRDSNKYGITN